MPHKMPTISKKRLQQGVDFLIAINQDYTNKTKGNRTPLSKLAVEHRVSPVYILFLKKKNYLHGTGKQWDFSNGTKEIPTQPIFVREIIDYQRDYNQETIQRMKTKEQGSVEVSTVTAAKSINSKPELSIDALNHITNAVSLGLKYQVNNLNQFVTDMVKSEIDIH